MYNKIELFADETDVTLLKAALNDLLSKVETEGDKYGVASTINGLITQLQLIKGE